MTQPIIDERHSRGSTSSATPPAPQTSLPDQPPSSPTARLREQVQKTARPCGCKSGAALSALALVGWPVWMWLSPAVATLHGVLSAVAAYPVVIIAAGVVGKVAGIMIGRQRHRWLRRRLAALQAVQG
jgi:hypothetical protein